MRGASTLHNIHKSGTLTVFPLMIINLLTAFWADLFLNFVTAKPGDSRSKLIYKELMVLTFSPWNHHTLYTT